MFDYLQLGTTPVEENCTQVNSTSDYLPAMKAECDRFIALLEKKFPIPEDLYGKVYFTKKSFTHEFGPYYEVIVKFDDDNEKAVAFAYHVEKYTPLHWED